MEDPLEGENVRRQLERGGPELFAELFAAQRARLGKMVRCRLNNRLRSRVDVSDVLQEVYVDAAARLEDFLQRPDLSFSLWLRLITGKRLIALHRQHVGAQMRDVTQEIPLFEGSMLAAASDSMAGELAARIASPSQIAMQRELQQRVQDVLESMEPLDREVLALRHFEELSNKETARVLGITTEAASKRHIRALKRLKDLLAELPFSRSDG